MTSAPHISIILPTYNSCETIDRAVNSVIQQTHRNWELIIIDDYSTDDTPARIQHYCDLDSRIKSLFLTKNQGQSHARNQGIALAKGAWLTLLDADDAYRPERLEHLLATAQQHKLDLLADNLLFFDAYLQKEAGTALPPQNIIRPWTLENHLAHDRIGHEFKWGLFKIFINTDFLRQCNLLYREQFRMAEDSLFYLELLTTGANAAITLVPHYIYTSSIGKISGQPSGYSNSHYSLKNHLLIFDYYEQHYGDTLFPTTLKLLNDSREDAIAADKATLFKNNLRRGKNLSHTLAMLYHHPRIIKHILLSFRKRIKRFFRSPFSSHSK